MTKNKIPDGWIGCPPKAQGIVDDIFVTFKVPLDERYNTKLSSDEMFTLGMCLREHRDHNIGLWIDLTNTDRYYNPIFLNGFDISYYKISIQGNIGPQPSQIEEFNYKVRDFLERNPGKRIAVHCTHGFNRTGYFICNFLATERKYQITDAIRHFAEMRAPGIYRQEYIDLLLNKFNSTETIDAPVISWKDPERRENAAFYRNQIPENRRLKLSPFLDRCNY